jgi:radical SAM family uncharacterized protein/radical SAM-linked protein
VTRSENLRNHESILPYVMRPGRYTNGELGTCSKPWTDSVVKFALAYPDIYEIGMSNLGFRILYHILNHRDDVLCERVFAPWPDMEEMLNRRGIPLWTLESKSPLASFDVLAFSLQYELNYTNVLNMLKLASVQLRAVERNDLDPLVIGGGCCALNPMPLSPFLDCFFIGEAEPFIPKIIPVMKKWAQRKISRRDLLSELGEIEGIWVPRFNQSARKQFLPELSENQFPSEPIVPFVEIKQDKLIMEISRGCTRGCRFCQAGIFYRPYRERSAKSVFSLTRCGLHSSGYREVSLLSLSASDHSEIEEIIDGIGSLREGLILNLPSLRGDSLNESIAQLLLAQGGVTIAPETGSEGLRRAANKDLSDDDIMRSCELAVRFGFTHIKLYYMIGLPGESEADIQAIVDSSSHIAKIARGRLIKLAISPFVPKPHTPFQWEAQEGVEALTEKIVYIRNENRRRNVKVKYRDPRIALLEGIFSRGGEELADALEAAWKRGLRFDGWSEYFKFEDWLSVFDQVGIDPCSYLEPKSTDDAQPWDHIDPCVKREFLLRERRKALEGEETRDCRIEGCHGCGSCEVANPIPLVRKILSQKTTPPHRVKDRGRFRYRVAYSKGESLRYLGHLDMVRVIMRSIERARIPIAYSAGAKPRPRVSFTSPLPLGMTSSEEYFDMITRIHLSDPAAALARVVPEGMDIHWVDLIHEPSSLSEIYRLARYRVHGLHVPAGKTEEFLGRSQIMHKDKDIRASVVAVSERDEELRVDIQVERGKPWSVFEWLSGFPKEEIMKYGPTREWLAG